MFLETFQVSGIAVLRPLRQTHVSKLVEIQTNDMLLVGIAAVQSGLFKPSNTQFVSEFPLAIVGRWRWYREE